MHGDNYRWAMCSVAAKDAGPIFAKTRGPSMGRGLCQKGFGIRSSLNTHGYCFGQVLMISTAPRNFCWPKHLRHLRLYPTCFRVSFLSSKVVDSSVMPNMPVRSISNKESNRPDFLARQSAGMWTWSIQRIFPLSSLSSSRSICTSSAVRRSPPPLVSLERRS